MGKRKHGGLTGLSGFLSKLLSDEHAKVEVTNNTSTTEENVTTPKKRKLDDDHSGAPERRWVKKYDATGLVPHYSDASEVPEHLQKYFYQRTRYLSLYSTLPGCLLDEEGWYSITPEAIANHIAERCRSDTIIDAFCGVGGNAIAFAKTCQRVIAIDNNPTRLALARHNAQIYGVADQIEFILADFISFAESYLASHPPSASNSARKIDAIFLSPPWGGPSYLNGSTSPLKESNDDSDATYGYTPYSLASIEPIHGAELFHLSRKITKNIVYYLPRNTRMEEVSNLLRDERTEKRSGKKEREEMVEVEEAWTGSKLKAITCYFGGLASGQEEMF
ncbi:Tgs1 protein [Amanita rubescens]|nr:Tgs1 protein [Amanita rubescens]